MATIMTPEERGWQMGKSLLGCISHMLEEQVGCDVTFQIKSPDGTITKISAHKFMLTARSPVFEAMFGGNFVETTQDPVITDIEPMLFKDILGYMYTDVVKLTGDNVLRILFGARKYMITSLEKRCTQFLANEISEENVASVLTNSLTFEDNDLENRCLEYICPKIKTVCKTEAFHNMSYDALLKVLKCDKLAEGFEADLFEQSMEWAKKHMKEDSAAHDKEMRTVLGECLHEIRFMSLTSETFVKRVAKFNVLTGDEKSALLCNLVAADKVHEDALIKLKFNMSSRMLYFERFSHKYPTEFSANSSGKQEIFNISFNTSVLLSGFAMYAPKKGTYSDVVINIKSSTGDNLGQISTKVTSDDTGQAVPVLLDKKIVMQPGKQYKVTATVSGTTGYGESHVKTSNIKSVTITSSVAQWPITYNTYDGYINSTTHVRGQIEKVLFQSFG